MDVLALYDIHGNLDALEAVLGDPRAGAVDMVVVGGDVVPGRFAVAVLERLERLQVPTRWLRGNGEREVGDAVGAAEPDPADTPAVTAAITARDIGSERAGRLRELPTTLELDGVLFCHATPRSDEEMLTRRSGDDRYQAALDGVDLPLVVAGHTHQQHDRRVGATRFVNAGSVGLPYEGDAAARWLLVRDGDPQLLRTDYDARRAGEPILAEGWPDRDSTVASLIDPIAPDVITDLFERRATG